MGAYNLLRAVLECYNCGHRFSLVLQVPLGWCRYDEYRIGDAIIWMTPEERVYAAEVNRTVGELRTMLEAGCPDWRDVAISAGEEECPRCHARGTALVLVEGNVFQRVSFVARKLPYMRVLIGEQVDGFLADEDAPDSGRMVWDPCP